MLQEASNPFKSCDAMNPRFDREYLLPLFSGAGAASVPAAALSMHTLSVRPHFSAIVPKVPSSAMSKRVFCTVSRRAVLPLRKPTPYFSEDIGSSRMIKPSRLSTS